MVQMTFTLAAVFYPAGADGYVGYSIGAQEDSLRIYLLEQSVASKCHVLFAADERRYKQVVCSELAS